MHALLGRWGNNLAVRLPHEIVDAVKFREGERVDVSISGGDVVLRQVPQRETLEQMFAGRTAEAWRAEYAGAFDWGPDVGRELGPE